ncbi:MAG TPA: hypothetical protein PLC24_08055, partial [Myxococcota bacterium]|nr:hypothetical protein [Myxococcota bacterium]
MHPPSFRFYDTRQPLPACHQQSCAARLRAKDVVLENQGSFDYLPLENQGSFEIPVLWKGVPRKRSSPATSPASGNDRVTGWAFQIGRCRGWFGTADNALFARKTESVAIVTAFVVFVPVLVTTVVVA